MTPNNKKPKKKVRNPLRDLRKERITNLEQLGLIPTKLDSTHSHNNGTSNYAIKIIQPWHIWMDYDLNGWDSDIIKRVLRTKKEPNTSPECARISDYKKIIHICQERIRQLSQGCS